MNGSAAKGVSVFVPAFNEEANLREAVRSAVDAARAAGNVEIEILIVDDGSGDATGAIAAELQERHPFIRCIRHEKNLGLGASFLDALRIARYPKFALFPADNVVSTPMLRDMLKNAYQADLVCAYLLNTECRTRFRNFLSNLYSFIYLAAFDIHLLYIHATPVYPTDRVRRLDLHGRRYGLQAEITVKLLRMGCTYCEIPGRINSNNRKSSALRLKNLFEAFGVFLMLIFEIYFLSRDRYGKTPVRVDPEAAAKA